MSMTFWSAWTSIIGDLNGHHSLRKEAACEIKASHLTLLPALFAIFAIVIAMIATITLWIWQSREIRRAVIRHPVTDCVRLVFHSEAIAGASKQVAETSRVKFIRCTPLILCQR